MKYGKAVNHAIALAGHIDSVMRGRGRPYEIFVTPVDEVIRIRTGETGEDAI